MNSVKPILLVSLLLFSPFTFAQVEVFSCEPEWKSLVEALGGNHVDVHSATTGLQDPHNIQARPSLIAKARRADLLVCSGAELEIGWLPMLLRKSGNPHIQPNASGYFMAAEQVELIDQPKNLDRSMGHVHAAGNPHVHLSAHRILEIAKQLSLRLQKVDAQNTADYQSNLNQFLSNWQHAMDSWLTKAAPLSGKNAVVYHKDWNYFFAWLGINIVASLEPKPGIPPTAGHLSKIKNSLAEQGADFTIRTAYQTAKPAAWLAVKTGIPAVELAYTVGGNEKSTDLFKLYDNLIDTLLQALNK